MRLQFGLVQIQIKFKERDDNQKEGIFIFHVQCTQIPRGTGKGHEKNAE